MRLIGGEIGYQLLRRISPHKSHMGQQEDSHSEGSKLEKMFGPKVWNELQGKIVIDFGCGLGNEAIEMAQRGARKVIGLDIRESVLEVARQAAEQAGVADRCVFTTTTEEKADVIFSTDAFEHFSQPENILMIMRGLLKDDGAAFIAFGPTWYHPLGGHLFSVFPWSHLVFTEESLIRWRSDFKNDGVTRFSEVDGGLNQMTIRRFEQMVQQSDFRFSDFEAIPINKLRRFSNGLTREFCTAYIKCRLVPRQKSSST